MLLAGIFFGISCYSKVGPFLVVRDVVWNCESDWAFCFSRTMFPRLISSFCFLESLSVVRNPIAMIMIINNPAASPSLVSLHMICFLKCFKTKIFKVCNIKTDKNGETLDIYKIIINDLIKKLS